MDQVPDSSIYNNGLHGYLLGSLPALNLAGSNFLVHNYRIETYKLIKRITSSKNLLITSLLCMVLCAPVYFFRITQPVDGDFGAHVEGAAFFLESGYFESGFASHPILQVLMITISKLSGGFVGLYASMLIIQVAAQGLLAGIVYHWLGNSTKNNWEYWRIAAAISVTFVAPVMLIAIVDRLFYYGYIGMANYHNPTINLLKPIALLCVIQAVGVFENQKTSWKEISISALLVIISAAIKPSFLLAFLPAIGVISILQLLRKKPIDFGQIFLGFMLPGVLVLAAQWLIMYTNEAPDNQIVWAPFLVESAFSNHLLPKFLLSVLFILQGIIVFRKELLIDQSLLLGLVMFLVGIFQNYLFAEDGRELLSGNFRWSGQIVTLLFVIIILRKSLRSKLENTSLAFWGPMSGLVTYLAHLGGGLAYYLYCLTSVHYR